MCLLFVIKGSSSPSPASVATVSISTSAVTTTTHRDHHITPENPFGVIGEVAVSTTAFQSNYLSFCCLPEPFNFSENLFSVCVLQTQSLRMKQYCAGETIRVKAVEQYFHVVLLIIIMLYRELCSNVQVCG